MFHHDPSQSQSPATPGRSVRTARRPNWLLICGLSALALLWPLAELTGMPAGAPRAATILGITAVCWIGVVGLGRFPRPVLTLALTGLGAGVLAHALAAVFGGGGTGPALWALPFSLALQAGWGAVAGLLAWAVQLGLGRRR
ncbi:hypothetical protein MUN78_01970 [Leucobacter allii]|uniref:Histidinol dehydrogenase n=1 Tax=Leucobacter allii TaxID=2932247 RepID=A0ABY4FMY1_9MICO|nr:hypothetical protein [Leucobacter allii]UOQ57633.1 hypothetical protein MUN78_01970 [Leucobacter allii]